MATQPTNLPVPSETPRDLKFNAGKIDEFVTSQVNTYIDRFGKQHYTIEGLRWLAQQAISQYGWIPVGTFQAGATLTLPNHILKDETDNEYYRWDGSFLPDGKIVPSGSTPSSSGGVGVGAWLAVGDSVLRSALASQSFNSPGSDLIGLPTDQNLTSYLSTGRGIDPRMPPYLYRDTDDIEKRTASLQAAFDASNNTKYGVVLTGYYDVNYLFLNGHTDYSVTGTGGIIARGTKTAALEMLNCRNMRFAQGISITIAGNFDYAVKVWSNNSGGTSLNTFGLVIANAKIAFGFGDRGYPDALVSEMLVWGGCTFNCVQVVELYGSQTVIEFSNYQMIANGNSSAGSGINMIAHVIGGVLRINGGEVIQVTTSSGQAFRSSPINSPGYGHAYGQIYISGAAMECVGVWFIAYNAQAVPLIEEGTGAFTLSGCHGYAGYGLINIQVADSFTGKITIDNTNRFHRLNNKTTAIVTASAGAYPICDISDDAFDIHFPKGFQKYNGDCVPVFSYRRIGIAQNLSGQTIAGSGNQTTLVFKAVDTTGAEDNSIFTTYYNTSTGVFTTPKGGLKSVTLYVQCNAGSAHANSDLNVMLNGTLPKAVINGDLRRVNGCVHIGNLAEGETISLKYTNGSSTSFSFIGGDSDYFAIFALR